MSVDRSKFKATSVAKVQEVDKAASQMMGQRDYTRADMLEIKEGTNMFRIYPPHPSEVDGQGEVYAEPVSRVFLPAMVAERDPQGNEIKDARGNTKMKRSMKPVFNSRLHGGTSKDLVEEYVRLGKELAKNLPEAERELQLTKLIGKYDLNPAKRYPGLSYQQSWVMYADQLAPDTGAILDFGRLEVKKLVKDQMNKVSAIEASHEPMGTDPFTSPDEGRAVCIEYNPNDNNPQKKYYVYIDNATERVMIQNRPQQVVRTFPLSDERLNKFMEYPSLYSLYRNSFKRSDFLLQLDGLRMFDQDNQIGVFELPEWDEIVNEISDYYPEQAGSATALPTTSTDLEGVEEDLEEDVEEDVNLNQPEPDMFSLMSREELKVYNKKEQLGVVVKTNMTDDMIRDLIRERVKATTIPHIPLPGEEGYQEPAPVTEGVSQAQQATGINVKDRLKNLRNKAANNAAG